MATVTQAALLRIPQINLQLIKKLHCSLVVCESASKWREQRKMSKNKTAFGPLTNLPDYSFKDGKVVPYGSHQKRRIDEQKENLLKIKKLVSEVDFAVERYRMLQEKAEEEKRQILDRKLKEKGDKPLITSGSEKE